MKRFSKGNVKSSGDLKTPLNKDSSSNQNDETNRLSGGAVLSKEDLDGLSLRDLIHLEQQYYGYLGRVRAKKEEVFLKQLADLKEVIEIRRSTSGNSSTTSVSSGNNWESPGDTGSSQGWHK